MASIRPEDTLKTKWQIRYRDRTRTPQETTDSVWKADHAPPGADGYTRAEVENEADWRQHLYDRDRYDPWLQDQPGETVTDEHLTLKMAVERYVQSKKKAGERGETGGWSQKTYSSDAPVLRGFARHAGPQTLLNRLRPEHLRDWVYEEELAEATKRGRWIRLRAMMNWWKERGWISDPPRLPGKPEKRKRIRTTLSPAQLEIICEAYQHLRKRTIEQNKHTTTAGVSWHPDGWRVTLYQGFRRSELLNLRVRNLMMEEGLIQVGDRDYQQKGKRESLVPLVDPARAILVDYLDSRSREERVFGTPETNDRVSRHFRAAVDFACNPREGASLSRGRGGTHVSVPESQVPFTVLDEDKEEIDFYTLRHSCATHWLRERRRLIWVKHLMRHQDISTTMQYTHLLPTDLREMYEQGSALS